MVEDIPCPHQLMEHSVEMKDPTNRKTMSLPVAKCNCKYLHE